MTQHRTSSIATLPTGWRIGRFLMRRPQRFTDMLAVLTHTDLLNRTLRKLCADGLAEKDNLGLYRLTAAGHAWIAAALPLLEWSESNPRNAPPRGNDPVNGRRILA